MDSQGWRNYGPSSPNKGAPLMQALHKSQPVMADVAKQSTFSLQIKHLWIASLLRFLR